MEYKYASTPPDKASMAQGQENPPPYQDLPPAGYPQPGPGQPQYVGGYPQQPYPGQPYPGQPYPGQPYTSQPYPQQTVIAVQQNAPLLPPENDYLGYSIFTLLCCCMPLGIAALIYSIITREANVTGDRPGAERSSRCARILNHTALGLGLVVFVLSIIYTRESNRKGHYTAAEQTSRTARNLNHAALGLGILSIILIIIYAAFFESGPE